MASENESWQLEELVQALDVCLAHEHLEAMRADVAALLQRSVDFGLSDLAWLSGELQQVLGARTRERACYYLRRLRKALTVERTNGVNDLNLSLWKSYPEVITDSLWLIDRRDNAGAHAAWYWGNFVPQIPHQLLLRYTHAGEWVLDPFVGSGTTLIECRRLGRNGIGVELNSDTATRAREAIAAEPNPHDVTTRVVEGDSTCLDYSTVLAQHDLTQVQLLILHPPYHDIIRFSADPADLSSAGSTEVFVQRFGDLVARVRPCLADGRYLAVVIGDKYSHGEWIPLGFYLLQAVAENGFQLKSIVIKNFEDTRAKRQAKALWRYRALAGGFYVFKHEYILIFRKR